MKQTEGERVRGAVRIPLSPSESHVREGAFLTIGDEHLIVSEVDKNDPTRISLQRVQVPWWKPHVWRLKRRWFRHKCRWYRLKWKVRSDLYDLLGKRPEW